MVGFVQLFSALVAAQAAVASPLVRSRTPYQLKESHSVPRQWKKVARAPAEHVIDLQIGLKQNNFAELERQLYEVSDPDHAKYGQHLSAESVNELVAPTDETLDLVHEWLAENGVTVSKYSAAKDWITVSLPIGEIEQLLDAEYHVYEHKNGAKVARSPKWSLPYHLHERIDTIQPTNSFFRARAEKSEAFLAPVDMKNLKTVSNNETLSKVCNISSVTPECFATLYDTKGYQVRATDKNTVAFTNYLGEHPIRKDAELFAKKYKPEALDSAMYFPQISLASGPGDYPLTADELELQTSIEANLDIDAILGQSPETPLVSYSTGGSPPFNPDLATTENTNEPYLVWVNWLLGQESIPQVISTSYADDEQTVPKSYAVRVCQQLAQVGARGTSLFYASGDAGVGPTLDECVSNDGKNKTMFIPLFPSSCPFVTTVGATMEFDPEVAVYRAPRSEGSSPYTSGGGFSNYFPMPDYQKDAASAYVKSLDGQYNGLYNKEGRGYPDISAQGLYFAVFWNFTEVAVSGTSASTPLTSSIMSLVNDALLASGKKPLGWLNPWLYKTGRKGLTDVVSGGADGCGGKGFPAKEGWDAVTGWGTPNFPELVKLAGGHL
ncbi:tripeptidyl-peptidase 1 precursor [Xylariomycetidae sp. FL0641]|nr:tripeptidyl-peptidase 1 precursor [Xylariomycetidae sp. FL0641]